MTKAPTHTARPERNDIPVKLLDIFMSTIGVDDAEITLDSALIDDLGADSLDIVELAMQIEDDYTAEVPDDEIERWRTVRHVVDYVATLKPKARSSRGVASADPS